MDEPILDFDDYEQWILQNFPEFNFRIWEIELSYKAYMARMSGDIEHIYKVERDIHTLSRLFFEGRFN